MPHRRLTPAKDATASTTPVTSTEAVPPSVTTQLRRAAMRLETDRLHIAALTAADIVGLVAYRRDPDVARYQPWDATYDDAEARQLIDAQPPTGQLARPGHWLQLGLHDQTSGELVGDIGLHTSADQPATYALGVTLAATHQGRGLATEACEAVLDHLFAAGAHRVTATCDVRNTASSRLLQRLGMRHEARLTDADWCKGEWTTIDAYAVLAHRHAPTPSTPPPATTTSGEQEPPESNWQNRPVRGVSFLGVHTSAFLDMRHLYAYVYGAPLLREAPGVAWFALADGAELHLYATTDTYHQFFGQGPVPGLLVDDYTQTERRLTDFGIEWLTQPDTANGRIWRHYRAPDGNVYELMGHADRPPEGVSTT